MSQDEYIRTALRVPPGLHKAIHESADNLGRSFNAEIVARLQHSFSGDLASTSTEELLKELAKRLGGLTIKPEVA